MQQQQARLTGWSIGSRPDSYPMLMALCEAELQFRYSKRRRKQCPQGRSCTMREAIYKMGRQHRLQQMVVQIFLA